MHSDAEWARTAQLLPLAMRQGNESAKVQGRWSFAVDDGNAYLAAGVAGVGIVCLPDCMAKASRARGDLVPLLPGWHLDPMPLYLAFPPNRHVSIKLRVFIDWIVELMADHTPLAPGGKFEAAAPAPPSA